MQDPRHDQPLVSRTGAGRQGNIFSFRSREKNVLDFSSYRSGCFVNHPLLLIVARLLCEGRQLYQVAWRYRFQRLAGLLPGGHASHDHKRVESFFPQLQRHPGAGRFARSSTVDINVSLLGERLEFL